MKRFFKKKAGGAINYMISLMALLLIAVLFLLGLYFRNVGRLSVLVSDSIDASNLATAVIDSNTYGQTNNYFRLIGSAQLSSSVSAEETDAFNKHLNLYTTALKQNLGLDDSFRFLSGGPAGFAVNQFIGGYSGGNNPVDKKAVINQFSIYDIVLDKSTSEYAIVEYTAYDIMGADTLLTSGQIQKTVYRDGIGCTITLNPDLETLNSSTVSTPDRTLVLNPTVYSKVSFRLKAPSIYDSNFFNPSGNNTIERIVSKESTADVTRGGF